MSNFLTGLALVFAIAFTSTVPALYAQDTKEDKKDDKKIDKDEKLTEAKAKKLLAAIAEIKGFAVSETWVTSWTNQLATYPTPLAGYGGFGVTTKVVDGEPRPVALQANLGGVVLNSCGKCAYVGKALDGTQLILVPADGSGFGAKIGMVAAVYIPFRDGAHGTATLVVPSPSETFKGYESFVVEGPGLLLVRKKK